MSEKLIKILLLLLIVADLGYSFAQYYHQKFDGDLMPIIAPSKQYETVLDNPFGRKALLEGIHYGGSNRYFSHQALISYFRNVPLWLQSFLSPVDSLYAAAALSKLLTHFALVFILCIYICHHFQFWRIDFIAIFLFITPFFQAYGYANNIGIISGSVTYLFFYALPLMLFLLFLLPFYLTFVGNKSNNFPIWLHPFWLILVACLPFSGALIAPLGIMICGIIFLAFVNKNLFKKEWKNQLKINLLSIKTEFWIYFSLLFLISCYSFYIARFNSENEPPLPYFEALSKLSQGLFFIATSKLAIPLMAIILGINLFLKKEKHLDFKHKGYGENPNIKKFIGWLWLFLFLYLMTLPFGGFRPYRAQIIRHDTFIPVTLGLIFTVVISTNFIFYHLKKAYRAKYFVVVMLILMAFTLADKPKYAENYCEKTTLESLFQSNDKKFFVPQNCTLFSWDSNPPNSLPSLISPLLKHWNITKEIVDLEWKKSN